MAHTSHSNVLKHVEKEEKPYSSFPTIEYRRSVIWNMCLYDFCYEYMVLNRLFELTRFKSLVTLKPQKNFKLILEHLLFENPINSIISQRITLISFSCFDQLLFNCD